MSSTMFDRIMVSRAIFNGHTLVGHADSLDRGLMLWAMHGGGKASSHELRTRGTFEKLMGPSDAEIKTYADKSATTGRV